MSDQDKQDKMEAARQSDNITAASQFDNITWAAFSNVGDELTVWNQDVKSLKYRDLRAVCRQLKFRGIKNATKEQMIKKLAFTHQVKTRYGMTAEVLEASPTRKEPQCPFRLLNILFSDKFAEGFSQLGNVASRSELDSGKVANNQLFWEGVQEAFQGQDPTIDNLRFDDDEVLQELHYIDFTKIVPHDWKKLRSIWKQINSHYKESLGRFTQSGTHSSNFFDFCEGRLETYYLRRHLEARPDLTGTVVADLPEEVFMESTSRPSSTISSSTKRKKDKDSEIADAIRDLKSCWKDPELNKKKMATLQKQEERWEAEQLFRQQDYALKQQEEARKTREHIFNEWEKLQRNVRELGLALETVSNPLLKRDMESDLVIMINKKNQLASMLNLNSSNFN